MKKIYRNYWFICLALITLLSCNNDNGEVLFTDTPAERIAQKNGELLNLLLAEPQGYKGVYFPKNDEFGGFTFYMKFNADGTVQTTSDFDSETAIETSSYEVRFGTTAELIFTTRGHVQKLSNPSLPGAIGTGFKGTSVFQYFSNENGVITFRDVRNTDTGRFVFTPTGFTDFDTESVASVTASLANRENFVNSSAVTAFPFLSVENGANLDEYALNYNNVNIFANPTTQAEDGSVKDVEFGMAFTEDGIIINPPLEVNGVAFENFTFDDTSGFEYISTVDGATAKIGYGNVPVTPLDAYAFGVRRNRAWVNRDEPAKSSNAFNNFYTNYDNSLLANYGINIRFILFRSLNDGGQPYLHIFTTGGAFWYDINFTITDGIVVFTPTGATNASPGVTAILQPILDALLGGPSGFYLNSTGSLEGFSNRTFSMINVADPTMEINYWDQ
ncbi:DUF4302 domain-containing protein [Flavivirga spongiicola]|uniref:DUF4302 domain-containing protein n=1 Tax=Flavivirga spongiicola TaxID=421621 RepID=A0ABU7XWG1_9FLAO|nr:DUF4302 domain-containing protein [Flavivirga sp. MEBiC05379]MDO5979770.1 DUF4302 domain-containing protein [Flavivirga sp. MEBiC05379]